MDSTNRCNSVSFRNYDSRLRTWFQSLCDDVAFNGLVIDGLDDPVTDLNPVGAVVLAQCLVEFRHAVAMESETNE